MIDPKEALKHIRTLAEVGSDSVTPELIVQHFNEILKIVEKALSPQRPTLFRALEHKRPLLDRDRCVLLVLPEEGRFLVPVNFE
ncbi:hypothetical protein AB8A05_00820 [Tardiphaga sp. 538_B7_N1_4]|uniref:hypothetical protein n=1 Tax=Tardiphaga sp. 538_B7_N1_4 TaxID=3240778 RepID=UPI003F21BEB2